MKFCLSFLRIIFGPRFSNKKSTIGHGQTMGGLFKTLFLNYDYLCEREVTVLEMSCHPLDKYMNVHRTCTSFGYTNSLMLEFL